MRSFSKEFVSGIWINTQENEWKVLCDVELKLKPAVTRNTRVFSEKNVNNIKKKNRTPDISP